MSTPQIGVDHLRVLDHVVRRAIGNLAARVQDDDPVAATGDRLDDMLDNNHGDRLIFQAVDEGDGGLTSVGFSPAMNSSSSSRCGWIASARAISSHLRDMTFN